MIESIKPVILGQIRDLTGQKFGLLSVINLHGRDNNKRFIWLCECECGATKVVASRHLVQGKPYLADAIEVVIQPIMARLEPVR